MNHLIISSQDNPDWNGSWIKGEVIDQIKEIKWKITSPNEWIRYILEHQFDETNEITDYIIDTVCDKNFRCVTLALSYGDVTIEVR